MKSIQNIKYKSILLLIISGMISFLSTLCFCALKISTSNARNHPSISSGVQGSSIIIINDSKNVHKGPLTSLRDQLVITIHDVEGNEISRTGVDTKLVVEKGPLDDLFPLEGVGYVHLKLQFVLSEEERRRIRDMRESALRQKHGELSSDNLRSPENATNIGSNAESPLWLNQEVSDSRKSLLQSEALATPSGFVLPSVDVIKNTRVGTEEREETFPNDTDRVGDSSQTVSQGFDAHPTEVSGRGTRTPLVNAPVRAIGFEEISSLAENSKLVVDVKSKLITQRPEESGIDNPEKQSPKGKTPSNVKNMISAFESSLSQDMRLHMKPLPAKSQSSKVATEAALKSSSSDELLTQKIKPTQSMPGRIKNPFLTGESQRGYKPGFVRDFKGATSSQGPGESGLSADVKAGVTADREYKLMHKEVEVKKEKNSSENLLRENSSKAATVSGRMLDEHIGRQQPGKLLVNKQHTGGKLTIKESAKGTHSEYFEEMDNGGTTNNKMRSKENWKDKHYSFRCSGTWIFPVESRDLCITTGGKEMMDLIRDCHATVAVHLGAKSSTPENLEKSNVHHGDIEANEVDKTNRKPRKPKLDNSADSEKPRGPIGQVMRVAIMIGFATLVVFTRQRNNG